MTTQAVVQTDLPGLKLLRKGKVRDVYETKDALLLVATDRLSAFDWVLPTPIPAKGKILTGISAHWFRQFKDVPNHFITDDVGEMPHEVQKHSKILAGRTTMVKKAEVLRVEFVVRGYLAGSGWSEYKTAQSVCGVKLPAGLRQGEKLPEPIFTPTTKEDKGHDQPITLADVERILGAERARRLRDWSLDLYRRANDTANANGLLLADTKFEWGAAGGREILIDEIFTPDSSRFWPADGYRPGQEQPSFDKQFVRDYLLTTGWDRNSPPPALPEEIVRKTADRYREAYRRIVGHDFK